jgi:hypothetical protein
MHPAGKPRRRAHVLGVQGIADVGTVGVHHGIILQGRISR